MSDRNPLDDPGISRRRLLRLSGGAVGVLGLGAGPVGADDSADSDSGHDESCPEPTLGPAMTHYDDSLREVCSDTHPKTKALQADVKESLERTYPTVGSLIDARYVPYFDFFAEGSWSHWLNPEFIGDDSAVDPDRPASILVDHTWWRPIGVMFVATAEGEPVDPPPTVYETGDDEDGGDENEDACRPWHSHTGLPGRYAWWKFRKAYGKSLAFPCRTPWMMHVWVYPDSDIYAHAPPGERGGPPAEDPGFDTDADPDEEALRPEHLPDALVDEARELWGQLPFV